MNDGLQRAMTALALGDRSQFDVVFRALWPRCRAFAQKLVADDALADDVAQQALLQLFHEAPRFDQQRSVVSWALTLTAWQARTAKKKRERRREDGEPVLAPLCGAPSPEDTAIRADLVAAALDVVDQLSADDKEAVLRSLAHDKSGDPSSRKRRQRALERLRSFWSARYG